MAILGISLMFSQDWIFHREMIKEICKKFSTAVIVVGGEHVTALPEFVLRTCPEIDFAVTGEGELTFLTLVHQPLKSQDTDKTPGCSYPMHFLLKPNNVDYPIYDAGCY